MAEAREELRQALETLAPPSWADGDLDGFLDSLTDLIDARIAADRSPSSIPPPSAALSHDPPIGSPRWLARRLVAGINPPEDIDQARQRLNQLGKRELIDLIGHLAGEIHRHASWPA